MVDGIPLGPPHVSTGELPPPDLVRALVAEALGRYATHVGGAVSHVYPVLALRPVLMSLAVASTAALLTPVATPANMMVLGPGATASATTRGSDCRCWPGGSWCPHWRRPAHLAPLTVNGPASAWRPSEQVGKTHLGVLGIPNPGGWIRRVDR
jgi:hypothetical protein